MLTEPSSLVTSFFHNFRFSECLFLSPFSVEQFESSVMLSVPEPPTALIPQCMAALVRIAMKNRPDKTAPEDSAK